MFPARLPHPSRESQTSRHCHKFKSHNEALALSSWPDTGRVRDDPKRQPPLPPFVMSSERSALLPAMLGTDNDSAYTLDTVRFSRPPTPSSHSSAPSYGSISHLERTPPSGSRDIIVRAGFRVTLIFAAGCIILGGTLWLALPTLDE